MATTRKQGDDQNQDATQNQQQNHAQTPDQQAANSGAYAQSSYQTTQQAGGQMGGDGPASQQSGGTDSMVNSAIDAGKKWLDEKGILEGANQVPQAVKEWGNKALSSVNSLSTTQKVVGGALLLAGAAYLSTRGKSKSKSSDNDADTDYRSGRKSSDYRQGSWAGYAGGKSASGRATGSGSRSADVSSYGTERRATSGGSSNYGRSTGSYGNDADFGSGSRGSRATDSGSSYGSSRNVSGGSYNSGSSYNSGGSYNANRNSDPSSSSSSSMGSRGGSSNPNSNEQDYDSSL